MPTPTKTEGLAALSDVNKLIVVAAHPDDLETMCGGTIALLVQRGVEVFSVNCTLGDIGAQDTAVDRQTLASQRLAETRTAAEILGIKDTFNLGRPDGELVADIELRAHIARLYRLTQADTLFTFDPFWAGQIHPDHRAAGQAALDAYMPSKMPLYRPEHLNEVGAELGCLERVFLFSTTRDPEIYIDVTGVYETKIAATLAHRSQFPQGEDNLDWLKALDEENGKVIQVTAAEALKKVRVW